MQLEWIEVGVFCGIRDVSILKVIYDKLASLPQLCLLKCCLLNLWIACNNILRLSKDSLNGFKKLKIVNLGSNNLNFRTLPDLHRFQNSLIRLLVNDNQISTSLQTSEIYRKLIYLTVSKNTFCNFKITFLRHMPKMGYLGLNGNKVTRTDEFFYAIHNWLFMHGNVEQNYSRCVKKTWPSSVVRLMQTQPIDTEWPSLPWVNGYFLRNSYFVFISYCCDWF